MQHVVDFKMKIISILYNVLKMYDDYIIER